MSFSNLLLPLTCFVVILCGNSGWGSSQGLACGQIFAPSASPVEIQNITVTSLAYSPVLEREGRFVFHADKVLLEEYKVKAKLPFLQKIVPFFDPVTLIKFPFVHFLHQQGLKGIYQAYENILDPKLKRTLESVESSLAGNRQMLVLVKDGNFHLNLDDPSKSLGFFRVFDGTFYHSGPRAESNYKTPLELILSSQGKSTKAVQQMRDKGYSVFELGKYFLKEDLSAETSNVVKFELRKWLFDVLSEYSEDDLRNTFYFAHVVSKINQRRYRIDYGFEAVNRDLSTGLDQQENILIVNGYDLFKKLKSQIEL